MKRALAIVMATSGIASADPAATLAKTEKYYAGLEHHTETFVVRSHVTAGDAPKPYSGIAWFDNGRYRYDVDQVSVIFDGASRWIVMHDKKQMTQSTEAVEPLAVRLLSGEPIASCCTVASEKTITGAVVLTPKKAGAMGSPGMVSLVLVLDASDGHLTRYIERFQGSSLDVTIGDPDVAAVIPKGQFTAPASYGVAAP